MASEVAVLPLDDGCPPAMLAPSSPHKTKIVREDSLKIVDPSRKKLVSLETQRIAGVLDECIRRVETISLLPTALACTESLSVGLGAELLWALQEHQRLGESFQALELGGLEGTEEGRRQSAQSTQAVRSSLQNVLRHLRACPTGGELLRGTAPITEEGEGSRRLAMGLRELRGVLLERLLMTPAEERERSRRMQEVSLRHRGNLELMATLEGEVTAAIKDRDEEISKKNETIRRLKSALHQMEKISEDFVARTHQDAEKQNQSDQKTSDGRRARMQQEAHQLQVQLNNLIAENREGEMALRKRKYKVETEIENWIQKYDADMGEKQAELEDMSLIFEEEQVELQELEEQYAVLELEYTQIMEERHVAQERREEEEREREVKSCAATIIQAYFRGFRVRKAMKGKGKGKKGKKGKGKKAK